MLRSEVNEWAKKRTAVRYEGFLYILAGYKVEYEKGGQQLSVLIVDNYNCKRWVKDFEKIERVVE